MSQILLRFMISNATQMPWIRHIPFLQSSTNWRPSILCPNVEDLYKALQQYTREPKFSTSLPRAVFQPTQVWLRSCARRISRAPVNWFQHPNKSCCCLWTLTPRVDEMMDLDSRNLVYKYVIWVGPEKIWMDWHSRVNVTLIPNGSWIQSHGLSFDLTTILSGAFIHWSTFNCFVKIQMRF